MRRLHHRTMLIAVSIVITFLIAAHIGTRVILSSGSMENRPAFSQLLERFNLDNEVGIGTWVNQSLLFLAAILVFIISRHKFHVKDKFKYHWAGLSLLLLFASIDEGTGLHELTAKPIQQKLSLDGGILGPGWVVLVLAILLVLTVVYFKFLLHFSRRFKILLISSLGLLVIGAIGLEIGAGLYSEWHMQNTGQPIDSRFFYFFTIPLEEGFEMMGSALFVVTFAEYLRLLPQASQHWKKLLKP